MKKVGVVCDTRRRFLYSRVIDPLSNLDRAGELELKVYPKMETSIGSLGEMDVLVLQDELNPESLELVQDANRRGVRVIYDYTEQAMQRDTADIRSLNTRYQILRNCDLLLFMSDSLAPEWSSLSVAKLSATDSDVESWASYLDDSLGDKSQSISQNSNEHIFVVNPTYLWPHQYISDMAVRSLMQRGYQVTLYTPEISNFHKGAIGQPGSFSSADFESATNSLKPLWMLPQAIEKADPDLVLMIQGYTLPRHVLSRIANLKVPAAVWLMDEPYDTSVSVNIGQYFSHVFVQDPGTVRFHRRNGNANTWYMPHGAEPDYTHAVGKELCQSFQRDVSMVGTPFYDRVALVAELLHEGIPVTVVGPGWQAALNDYFDEYPEKSCRAGAEFIERLSFKESAEFYHTTKINLNVHRSGDDFSTTDDSITPQGPNCSLFYIAGSRGFQLVDSSRQTMTDEYFQRGREIIYFESAQDCVAQVRRYLETAEDRNRIANAAYERVCREHTYGDRLEKMIEISQSHECIHHRRLNTNYTFIDISSDMDLSGPENDSDQLIVFRPPGESGPANRFQNHLNISVEPEQGFAAVLNLAAYQACGDFIVVGTRELWSDQVRLGALTERFGCDLDLGMISFVDPDTKERCGFMIPVEQVLELGIFTYSSAEHCLDNLDYNLISRHLVVEHVEFSSDDLSNSVYSQPLSGSALKSFRHEWSEEPMYRIESEWLLGISESDVFSLDERGAILHQALEKSETYAAANAALGRHYLSQLQLVRHDREKLQSYLGNSIRFLQHAWHLDCTSSSTGLSYAIALRFTRQKAKAQNVLKELSKQDLSNKDLANVYQQMAKNIEESDPEKAIEHYKISLDSDSSNEVAVTQYASLLRHCGQLDAAESVLRVFLERDVDVNVLAELAKCCQARHSSQEAYQLYREVLDIEPKMRASLVSFVELGVTFQSYAEIYSYVGKYLAVHPNDPEIASLYTKLSGLCG